MPCNNSPLETLAAFVIAFVLGAITSVSFINHIAKVRLDERNALHS